MRSLAALETLDDPECPVNYSAVDLQIKLQLARHSTAVPDKVTLHMNLWNDAGRLSGGV